MKSLGVYVINLQSRPDRLAAISNQLSERSMDFIRVEACTPENTYYPNLSPSVGAIYHSHKIAMELFINSTFDFALILEDDALLDERVDFCALINRVGSEFDFIQVGFLKNNLIDHLEIIYFNLRRKFIVVSFRIASKLLRDSKLVQELRSRLSIREHLSFPPDWVSSNIQAGAHAYIVSKNFAAKTLEFAANPFLAIDDFYMALGRMRLVAMYRLKKSKVSQSNSRSDVVKRFKMNFED